MTETEQARLEEKALKMAKTGMTGEEVEKELGHEFVFFRDSITGEYNHATLWKPKQLKTIRKAK